MGRSGHLKKCHNASVDQSRSKRYNMDRLEPQLEFWCSIYRRQCVYCGAGCHDMRCRTHRSFVGEYKHRLILSSIGQRGSLIKIDTDYIHKFTCDLSEICDKAVCLNCEMWVAHGEETVHTQYLRIKISEQWIVGVIMTVLNMVRLYQKRDMLGNIPEGVQSIELPERPQRHSAEE